MHNEISIYDVQWFNDAGSTYNAVDNDQMLWGRVHSNTGSMAPLSRNVLIRLEGDDG